jgi:hypothetical protein
MNAEIGLAMGTAAQKYPANTVLSQNDIPISGLISPIFRQVLIF